MCKFGLAVGVRQKSYQLRRRQNLYSIHSKKQQQELKLPTQQILSLHTYLHGGIRDKQMKGSEAPPLEGFGEVLFTARCYDIVLHSLEELKGINPQIKNAQHIRASVILY